MVGTLGAVVELTSLKGPCTADTFAKMLYVALNNAAGSKPGIRNTGNCSIKAQTREPAPKTSRTVEVYQEPVPKEKQGSAEDPQYLNQFRFQELMS
ncbi:hypothetical protein NDU88_004187, partial [Pleurodeles waltl]